MSNDNPRSNAMNTNTFDWSTVTYIVNDDGERIITGYKTVIESVLVSELNVGDVVHTNGMHVLLDRDPIVYNVDGQFGPAYSYNGKVLNIDEIDDPFILSMSHVWDGKDCVTCGKGHDSGVRGTGEHRWTVQSNDLCRWAREVR